MKSMEEMMAAAQEAAQTVQRQMNEAQAKLESIEVEGAAAMRSSSICLSAGTIRLSSIDTPRMRPLAVARTKADRASEEEMGKMAQGLPLPAGFKLPF